MSKRNSQAAKTAAREKLRLERERQAKRDKVKRQAIVAGSIVAVLAIAGGVGYAVVQNNKPSYWAGLKDAKVVAPANTTGTKHASRHRQEHRQEDPQDLRGPALPGLRPVRADRRLDREEGHRRRHVQVPVRRRHVHRRQGQRPGLQERAERPGRRAERQFRGVPRVQDRAVLDEVTPDETTDKFKDDAYLLKVADTVPALKGNTAFQNAVKKGTYDAWAMAMSKTFDDNKEGVTGTPGFVMDGKQLNGGTH